MTTTGFPLQVSFAYQLEMSNLGAIKVWKLEPQTEKVTQKLRTLKKKNFRIQISKLRNEQNPFEKPAKNLEQNSLDSLLMSTTWKRGKKRNQKLQTERRTKAAERKKKKKGKTRNQKLQTDRRTKAAERKKKKRKRKGF